MITIDEILANADQLAPLSPTTTRLVEIVGNSSSTVNDIVGVIKFDQVLTADVLKFANSVASGANREITSVKDAIIRLGGGRILKEIVSRHIMDNVSDPLPGYGYPENDLWQHSVAAAVAAETMSDYIKIPASGFAYIGALLHDLGKLLLERSAPREEMEKIWYMVNSENNPCTCEKAERSVFGFTHADIGAEVIKSWKLPDQIVKAVREHHSSDSGSDIVMDSVRISNYVARSIGAGIGFEGMSFQVDNGALTRLGFRHENFEKLCAATLDKYRGVMDIYGCSK